MKKNINEKTISQGNMYRYTCCVVNVDLFDHVAERSSVSQFHPVTVAVEILFTKHIHLLKGGSFSNTETFYNTLTLNM